MNIIHLTQEQWQQLITLHNARVAQYISLIKPQQIPRDIWNRWEKVVNQHLDKLSKNRTKDDLVGNLTRIAIHGIKEVSINTTADQLCGQFGINPNATLNQELPLSGVGFITLDTNDILEFVKYKVESLRDMSNLELYKFLSQNKEQIKEMMR